MQLFHAKTKEESFPLLFRQSWDKQTYMADTGALHGSISSDVIGPFYLLLPPVVCVDPKNCGSLQHCSCEVQLVG